MITAECHQCGQSIEVPTRLAQIYVMQHKMPCRDCANASPINKCKCTPIEKCDLHQFDVEEME